MAMIANVKIIAPEDSKKVVKVFYDKLIELEKAKLVENTEGSIVSLSFKGRACAMIDYRASVTASIAQYKVIRAKAKETDKESVTAIIKKLEDILAATEFQTIKEKKAFYNTHVDPHVFQATHDSCIFECPLKGYEGRKAIAFFYNELSSNKEALELLEKATTKAEKKKIIKKYTELTSITISDMKDKDNDVYAYLKEF